MNPTRPRVVRLITRLNIGGPARQALLLTKELSRTYETTLGAGWSPAGEGELGDPDVAVERLPFVRTIDPVHDARAYAAVRRLMRQKRPALVHTHMAKAGTIGRMSALRVEERPRTIHTFHGHVLEGYFRPLVQRSFIAVERWLGKRTDVLIAVSEEIRDQLVDLGIGRPSSWVVIPLGFDLSSFLEQRERSGVLRSQLGLAEEFVVGVLGRLAPIKDHATLLEAMVDVPEGHLVVLGDGDLRSELEQRARDLGIAERVHFLGWRTDVAAVLGDVDAVALTSRNEGSPVSLIEALATGRPAVATDVGGVRSVVKHDVTGLLVPPGRPAAVAEELRKLQGAPSLRSEMGIKGREDVRSRYSKDRLVADIDALYSSLVGS